LYHAQDQWEQTPVNPFRRLQNEADEKASSNWWPLTCRTPMH
jgi:hypothetical protein